ncbi:MAG: D-alanyl-D-alanine carboxypeptidase/D-alanyl-D-alanine-endopeptidase [Pseudomonadota bacterium]
MRFYPTAPRLSHGLIVIVLCLLSSTALAALPEPVLSVLDRYELDADDLSLLIQPVGGGDVVIEHNTETLRNPASTMKLVTTMAALDVLKPNYQWTTDIILLGELDRYGVLHGDLAIRGGGDPYLVEESIGRLVAEMRRRGLQHITGDILLDDSAFSLPPSDPGEFDGEPLRAYNVAPDALLMNFKVLRFFFEPDPATQTVRVTTLPELPELQIENDLKLIRGRCRGYQKGIAVHAEANANRVRFSGTFPDGCERYSLSRSLLTHDGYAAALLNQIWLRYGGRLDGVIRSASVAEDAEVWLQWDSRPLSEQIRLINKYSNNVMTRQLFLTMGAETFGWPGSLPKARAAVAQWLSDSGLDAEQIVIDNGAGLSRDTRISATSLARLLSLGWHSPFMPEFVASMSLVGLDGTFRRRFRDGPLTGQAHLKTGRLDGVTAMAGYATARDGRRYIVVSLHNAPDVHRGTGEVVQNAILQWLHRYEPRPVRAAEVESLDASDATPEG